MPEINRPGVEVTQEFVTTSPSIIEPTLSACLFGPAFRIISAFDDNGDAQAEALAGTYRDGQGVVAYDLPSKGTEDDVSGFEDDARVFLLLGDVATELNGEVDEELILDDYDGDYTDATKKLVDLEALYTQVGVEAGDVIRITYKDEIYDFEIASVDSDTELTLVNAIGEDLAGLSYDVVRNAAQFAFSTGSQADVDIGTDADYIQFTAALLKSDGITPGDYLGDDGDQIVISLVESEVYLSGTDGVIGGSIFYSGTYTTLTPGTATFLADVGARGDVTGTAQYLFTGDPLAVGNGLVLREITQVFSDAQLTIETGETPGGSGLQWTTGAELTTGADGVTSTSTTFTSASATFNTDIPNTAGTPDNTTYVEIEGDGVYQVATVVSDTELTLAHATGGTATNQSYTVIDETSSGADGATGALTNIASISGDFTTIPAVVTSKSFNRDETEAVAITSVDDADNATVAAFGTSSAAESYKVVDTTAPLQLSWDEDTTTVSIQLARAAGLTGNTHAEIVAAVDTDTDPAYNVAVDDVIDAAAEGAGSFTGADLPITVNLDGGADDDQIVLDEDLIGSTTPTANVYVSWKGLRVDISDQAANPALLSFNSTVDVENDIGPISTDNPLALAYFFALANSPTNSVKGLGISEVTASKPFGTLEAYVSCLEYLESHDVYFMVPLTQDPTVHGVVNTHVDAMSEPENKAERVAFINQAMPEYSSATNVASGTTGNTGTVIAASPAEFSTSVNLAAAGVQAGDILVVGALADSGSSPDVVNGTIGPLYGIVLSGVKAGDDYVAEFDGAATGLSTGWNNLIDVDWTIYRAGSAIASASSQAAEIALVGTGFENRRMFFHWPDEVFADIGGVNFGIPGFYACAAWAGKAGQEPPQQGFTNTTIAGFTGLSHSTGYFTNSQLNNIAGGGTWITIQESQSAPLKCRHQLATDVSTLQKREFSITKAIDYVAKFLRIALSKQIGKFNITQSFLDALATTVQGLGRFLVESGVVRDFVLSSIEQNEDSPDTVDITVLVTPLYPANYIAITLQI